MDRAELASALRRILPAEAVVDREEALSVYESDGLTAYRRTPFVVALPDRIEQVQAVMRLCADAGVPVVARGAGTGLSGGALPHEAGVLLVLSRMQCILEVDPDLRVARVEPGVRNLAISEAAAPHGLFYAPDPSSQIACSIGGNVGGELGRVHCLKYGLTVHNVLAVKLVTAEGELVQLGGDALDVPGLDLLALVTGSEGLLGMVVEVTVRLLPRPECVRVLLAGFDAVDAAGQGVADVIAAGILPAGMELMDRLAIRAAEDFVHAGYPECEAVLIVELDGTPDEVDALVSAVDGVLQRAGATSLRVSRDDADRERLWAGRKAAFPAVGRIAPDYYCMDGTIPRRHLAKVLRRIADLSAEYGLPVANVFHAGDGNLHPLILYDANRDRELEQAEAMGARILEFCVEVGGTITGEHGVGIEKIDQMCVQFGGVELQRFHDLKAAFDPAGLLNPGKAVPTLARCSELGGMHVHGGELPHPELERF
ncbi:MAG: FAD-linked oxidase C-terminal domain-containing protein [Gammaproteobacteria bacterium]|nr:FAD-linked oxidase C-terminal domain-containing protein [Gammaproteobacteria bacterium]